MIPAIYSYNQGSRSSKELSELSGIPRIKHRNSNFVGNPQKVVFNWGSSTLPDKVTLGGPRIINRPESVYLASNKIAFFDTLQPVRDLVNTVGHTKSKITAGVWLKSGITVVARTIVNGHSGDGIIIVNPGDELPDAPLYTAYQKKKEEFRLHVFRNNLVDVQRKAVAHEMLEHNKDEINWQVRNHANGFIYTRGNVVIPAAVVEQAKQTVRHLGLDFGAVDIIWNEFNDKYYVLEVNTAPGLSGTTAVRYESVFKYVASWTPDDKRWDDWGHKFEVCQPIEMAFVKAPLNFNIFQAALPDDLDDDDANWEPIGDDEDLG